MFRLLALPRWYQELLSVPIVYGMLEAESNNFCYFAWRRCAPVSLTCNLFIVATRKMTLCGCNTWCLCKPLCSPFLPIFYFINLWKIFRNVYTIRKIGFYLTKHKKQNSLGVFIHFGNGCSVDNKLYLLFQCIAFVEYTQTHPYSHMCSLIHATQFDCACPKHTLTKKEEQTKQNSVLWKKNI